jgi:hypothetical protein
VLRDNCARTSTIFRCYRIRRFEAAPALWTPINQLELGSAPWMGQQQLLAGWLRRISYETTVIGDVPLSRMSPPLRNALLMTEMPPGPIAPALVTPPLKVVWLITIAEVWPLKTVGYGPLNAIGALQRRCCAQAQGDPLRASAGGKSGCPMASLDKVGAFDQAADRAHPDCHERRFKRKSRTSAFPPIPDISLRRADWRAISLTRDDQARPQWRSINNDLIGLFIRLCRCFELTIKGHRSLSQKRINADRICYPERPGNPTESARAEHALDRVGRAQRSERVPGRAFCEFEIAQIDSEPQT